MRLVLLFILCLLPAIGNAQPTVLVFGDSLSAGYGIPRATAWASLLQIELQRTHPHYKVVNASVSGETTSGGLQRLPATLKEHRPDIVILELGANDGLRGTRLDLTEKNLKAMILKSKAAGAKVLLLGMQIPPNYGIDYTKRFSSLYTKLAQQYRIELVPFMLEGVTLDQFQPDNLHPVAEAQPKILENVLLQLMPMLP